MLESFEEDSSLNFKFKCYNESTQGNSIDNNIILINNSNNDISTNRNSKNFKRTHDILQKSKYKDKSNLKGKIYQKTMKKVVF